MSTLDSLTQLSTEEQVALLERSESLTPEDCAVLVRQLARVRDGQVWHLGWSLLLGNPCQEAQRFAEWLVDQPFEIADLPRQMAFHYLYNCSDHPKQKVVQRGVDCQDPSVRIAAASKFAEADPRLGLTIMLDAHDEAFLAGRYFAETVEAWLLKLAAPAQVELLKARMSRVQDEDLREQYGAWIELVQAAAKQGKPA